MFYLQQFYQHWLIFYSSQEEEVDYSINDVDGTNDNSDMDNSTPDDAVEDDPQDEDFEPDDGSSDGESDNIGDLKQIWQIYSATERQ